ncbi:protein UXT [Sitodiplosis mosellana]|uniref:protein UXT n=1 Tax=Sitodiplosis mosellana TaxID=263140 RepID=UPI0024443CCC|nr:protein UXT [Sitodiplosis mosellana]
MPADIAYESGDVTRKYSTKSREQIESFIEEVLRKELKTYEDYINKLNGEIMEFVQLKNLSESISQNLSDGFKTQVNIGGNFFMSAKVPDSSKIMVNVGLNHYVEFTIDEAIKFCDFKVKSLQNEADVIREKSIETRAHIKLALLCIAEKENLLKADT